MDVEVAQEQLRIATKQLKNAIDTIAEREKTITNLQAELEVMVAKVINTEKDAMQARAIMTQNITESNQKINDYVQRIQVLKAKLQEAAA